MIRRILLGLTFCGAIIGGLALLVYERQYDGAPGERSRVFAASFVSGMRPMQAALNPGYPVATPAALRSSDARVPQPLEAAAYAPTPEPLVMSEQDREELDAYLEEASTYVQANDWEGAAEMYNRALAIAPTNPVASNGLRNAEIKMREIETREY